MKRLPISGCLFASAVLTATKSLVQASFIKAKNRAEMKCTTEPGDVEKKAWKLSLGPNNV